MNSCCVWSSFAKVQNSLAMDACKIKFGRLLPTDPFFRDGDVVCHMFKRMGVFDVDTEELCHKDINNLTCEIPGCGSSLNSLMELELHYNSVHRYTCATCQKPAASAHLLDLHIEETHDSFFAVQAERKPMFRCLVEECSAKFTSAHERHTHCVDSHAFPTNFRWVTPKVSKLKSGKKKTSKPKTVKTEKCCIDTLADSRDDLMDVGIQEQGTATAKPVQQGKHIHEYVFGRGKKKKTFTSKNTEWHKRDAGSLNFNALESPQLSSDLLECLPCEEMS